MKDNQRYFEVYDQEGKLINCFISVRNGNKDHLENVISGNEKVLVARLDDAVFFYDEDRKYRSATLLTGWTAFPSTTRSVLWQKR